MSRDRVARRGVRIAGMVINAPYALWQPPSEEFALDCLPAEAITQGLGKSLNRKKAITLAVLMKDSLLTASGEMFRRNQLLSCVLSKIRILFCYSSPFVPWNFRRASCSSHYSGKMARLRRRRKNGLRTLPAGRREMAHSEKQQLQRSVAAIRLYRRYSRAGRLRWRRHHRSCRVPPF